MNLTPERVKELRERVCASMGERPGLVITAEDMPDLLSLLSAQAEPTSGEREEMVAYLNFKIEDNPAFYSAKFNYGHREREVLKAIRSLILSPRVVSREMIDQLALRLYNIKHYDDLGVILEKAFRSIGIEVEP